MSDTTGVSRRKTELFMAGAALLVSVAALTVTIYFARHTETTAQQALDAARQANDIAIGRIREYPKIHVQAGADRVSVLTLNDIQRYRIGWYIRNTGVTPVVSFTLTIIAISGFTYCYEIGKSMDKREDVGGFVNYKVGVGEQLLPNDFVVLDITKQILAHVRNMPTQYADWTAAYRSTLNVIFLPQESDKALPVQTPGETGNDRRLIDVEYVPSVLKSEPVGRYLDSLTSVRPNIYGTH